MHRNIIILLLIAFLGAAVAEESMEAVALIMKFESNMKSNIIGEVTFQQQNCEEPVNIHVNISELPEGKRGFHVHEKGDLTNGCTSAGAHFNPYKNDHGGPGDGIRHIGDLGNIEVDDNGIVNTIIRDKIISLFGADSIIGRAIVIHEKIDDLGKGDDNESKKTGNAGPRIACGVIGIK